jgi:DNA recombination-mediator protein A
VSGTCWRRWATVMSSTPPDLRTRGVWPPPAGPRVAIVGARRPTPYGEAVAERLATDLARAGVVVVSGLALGVDSAAHEGALLAEGRTVAVLGTGIDILYPASNAGLAGRIVAGGGALVSQFPDGTPPRRSQFPRRNLDDRGARRPGRNPTITSQQDLPVDRSVDPFGRPTFAFALSDPDRMLYRWALRVSGWESRNQVGGQTSP